MEIKFRKTACPCLRNVITQVNTQEQTHELRLPDAMPDIGKVLGAWGQILVRSKEWRGSSMTVTGGIMAWILYQPEDVTAPRNLDAWIPFQMKWDFPQTERDCAICIQPRITSMDARGISARKLMIRADISILGEALEPTEVEIYEMGTPQEDIQLLKNTYFMVLPREAGEKSCQIQEDIIIPPGVASVEQILRYELCPSITERKVLAGRLVFKGIANLCLLYQSSDGKLHKWTTEFPFSQFAELDRDYSSTTDSRIHMLLSGLELTTDEQKQLHLNATMSAQFVIYETIMAEMIEDAYSITNTISPHKQTLTMPVLLDRSSHTVSIEHKLPSSVSVMDLCVYMDHPKKRAVSDQLELSIPCFIQGIYLDEEGIIQSYVSRSEGTVSLCTNPDNSTDAYIPESAQIAIESDHDGLTMNAKVALDVLTYGSCGADSVIGLEIGDPIEHKDERPSLIIKRAGSAGLWHLAKACGTTIERIKKANELTDEPAADRLLLIPIP